MNLKVRINKLIIKKISEIVIVFSFMIVITILCKKNKDLGISMLLSEENLSFTNLIIENPLNYVMYPMNKTEAINRINPAKIIIKNDSLTSEKYNLLLKISKKSTLDFQYLNISVNNKTVPLNTFFLKSDKSNYYFLIETKELKGESREYSIKIWLDKQANYNIEKNKLISSFEIVKKITKI